MNIRIAIVEDEATQSAYLTGLIKQKFADYRYKLQLVLKRDIS